MFKHIVLYRLTAIPALAVPNVDDLEVRAKAAQFLACGSTQIRSAGWTPPRGHKGGALVEFVGGQILLRLTQETRSVPTQAVKEELAKRLDKIQDETGRRPKGKKAKEIQEDVIHALLPRAFPRRTALPVWIDPVRLTLAVGASSLRAADEAATRVVELLPGVSLLQVQTATSPALAMASWLKEKDAPAGFIIERECELKQPDSEKATVRYTRQNLDLDEVADHVQHGKLPTQLALTWCGRVSFVLTDGLVLKKLHLLEEIEKSIKADGADAFDADVAISTGELRALFVDLIAALDGEVQRDLVQAAAEEPAEV